MLLETPFLSFACFAVQLLLPNYYYSASLYLLLCYELSFFSLGEDLVVLGQLRMQSEIFLEPSSLSLSHVMNNVLKSEAKGFRAMMIW